MYSLIVFILFSLTLTKIGQCQVQPTLDICTHKVDERLYDFRPLSNTSVDYALKNDKTNETIRFQLCHELKETCNTAGGYAACLMTNTSRSIGIGKFPPEIHYNDGGIIFRFIGDTCKSADKPYNLTIIMHCDYSEKNQQMDLFPYTQGACDFVILWKTKQACVPQSPKSVNCTTKNTNGDLVDLTPLKNENENYVIAVNNKSSIVLNVCHSVIPGYGAVCLESSAACFRNETSSPVTYSNIGDVKEPELINGTITLTYDGGKVCKTDHSTTTISFICDYKANNSHPVVNNTDGCNYKLIWKTAAACSKKDLEAYRLKTANPCKIKDPVTKIEYDLENFKGNDHIVTGFNGTQYKFSVCGPLLNTKCEPTAGVCSSANHQTEGLANSNLLWSADGPYLNYTNGSLCGNDKHRNTTILFTCAAQTMDPMITIEEPCHLKIQLPTNLVCPKRNVVSNESMEANSTVAKNDSIAAETTTKTTTTTTTTNTTAPTTIVTNPTPPTTGVPTTTIFSTTSNPQNESVVVDKSTANEKSPGAAEEIKKAAQDDGGTSSHGGTIALVVILIIVGLFGGVYLANPRRRELVFSYCTASCLRRSRTRMQYSEVNSVEETNLLLDAPDTRCQSDSDDDLLRI